MTHDEMVAALREAGWTVLPPRKPEDEIPEPQVGQVWVSPKARVRPRTIVEIGPRRCWPGQQCVSFLSEGAEEPSFLHRQNWDRWVKKSQARPA